MNTDWVIQFKHIKNNSSFILEISHPIKDKAISEAIQAIEHSGYDPLDYEITAEKQRYYLK